MGMENKFKYKTKVINYSFFKSTIVIDRYNMEERLYVDSLSIKSIKIIVLRKQASALNKIIISLTQSLF